MVQSSVVRLVPRLESFEVAVAAYRSGDLDRALSALHGRGDVRSTALRARIFNRTQRSEEALEQIEPVLASELSNLDAAELTMLKAYALANVGEPVAAEQSFVEARIKALLSGSLALEAEVEASTAFLHFSLNRFEEAKKASERVLRVTPTEALWLKRDDSAYFIPITESRARAYNWLGLIAAVDGDYRSQASYTRTAIEELETSSDIDAFLYCTFLRNFAVLARDLDSPGAFEFVRKRADAVVFLEGTKQFEFEIRRSLGWCCALRGDFLGGLRELRMSADSATTIPWRIVATVDRSWLAREINEKTVAREELEYAVRLSKTVNWEACRGEERIALLYLAKDVAQQDVKHARHLLNRYETLKSPLPAAALGRRDRRFCASENQAVATVLRAEGEIKRASTLLIEAHDILAAVGYEWEAATVAADLAEMTGERHFYDIAMREAKRRPHSWLARRLQSLVHNSNAAVV